MRSIILIAVCLSAWHAEVSVAQSPTLRHYEIDAANSRILVLVYRGGLLGGLGHNHVVAVQELKGELVLRDDMSLTSLQLAFPVTAMRVDEPHDRSAAGKRFKGTMSEKNIRGTMENMLGDRLLQAETYASIEVVASDVTGRMPDLIVHTETKVRDHTANIAFPVHVSLNEDKLLASGTLSLSHADLGLKPFKAVLGTLRVKDELDLIYDIVAIQREEQESPN